MRPSCAKSNVASLIRTMKREESEVSTSVRCKGRGGVNSNLESIIEELREWYHSNRDLCRTSTHRTRFKMKGPEEREFEGKCFKCGRLDEEQDKISRDNVPARNESEWSGGRHLHVRETRQVRWQNGLEFRDEGSCESHRSAGERARAGASLEWVQQHFILIMLYMERSQVQGECVHDRRKGDGKNANRC